MERKAEHRIKVDQLQVGIYIHIDLGWMAHPFSFNSFKIRSIDQIETIRQLGLSELRWEPDRSDCKPLAPATGSAATEPLQNQDTAANPATKVSAAVFAAKQARIERLKVYRQQIAQVEREFRNSSRIIRSISQTIFSLPGETLIEANRLVGQLVETLLAAPDLAIHVMNDRAGEDIYSHALNVSVLAMILAREIGLTADKVHTVGLGALFHDIGLSRLPGRLVNTTGSMTKAEREFFELHCEYGVEIAHQAGLDTAVQQIIGQHHEHYDGSGYPQHLSGEAIDPLARIVGLATAFDSLCNPSGSAQGLTPHEALGQIYAQYRRRYDPKLLQAFIRFMGVYPAGTVVVLSNGAIGMVIAVNAGHALKPTLIVYDEAVPRNEAIVLDLTEEADIKITKSIRPNQLAPAVYDYLSPSRRTSYYFAADGASSSHG